MFVVFSHTHNTTHNHKATDVQETEREREDGPLLVEREEREPCERGSKDEGRADYIGKWTSPLASTLPALRKTHIKRLGKYF